MKTKKHCYRCGTPNHHDFDWCDRGALLPAAAPSAADERLLLRVLVLVGFALVLAALSALLSGCGPAFDANTFSSTGAGGDINTMSEAGAGGRDQGVKSDGDAGKGTDSGNAGGPAGASGGTGDSAGSAAAAGAYAGTGGRGMGTGGISGAVQGGAAGTCLNDWNGSSCDTCTGADEGARSCVAVLDCYAAHPLAPLACDYSEPTSDAQVMLAHAVLACRCERP